MAVVLYHHHFALHVCLDPLLLEDARQPHQRPLLDRGRQGQRRPAHQEQPERYREQGLEALPVSPPRWVSFNKKKKQAY